MVTTFKRSKAAEEALIAKGANIDKETGDIQNLDEQGNVDPTIKTTQNLENTTIDTTKQTTIDTVPKTDIKPIEEPIKTPTTNIKITPTPKIEETPTIETPEQVAEKQTKIESDNLAVEEQKKVAEKQANIDYTAGFDSLLEQGATQDELNSYLNSNRDLYNTNKTALSVSYKTSIQNKRNSDFVNTYGNFSNEQLNESVNAGDVILGSKEYNLLSPEQRTSYEGYKANQDLLNDKANIVQGDASSFNSILTEIKKVFSSDIKKEYTDLLNSPEIKNLESKSTSYTNQINNIDDQIEYLREDALEAYPDLAQSSFLLNGVISDRKSKLIRERNGLVNSYNTNLSAIANKKADIETNLELSQYEDTANREAYTTALNLYNTERARIDEQTRYEVESKSKEIAAEKDKDFKLELIDIQDKLNQEAELRGQEYADKNKKGTYQTDTSGNLLWIVDGDAQIVKSDMGTVVMGEKTKGFEEKIYQNSDGTFSVIRTYDDGKTPTINSFGANGDSGSNSSISVQDYIDECRVDGQCGEGVNDYLQNLGETRIFGDSWESKKKQINSQEPAIGGVAIWNAGTTENGHVGIVTGVNPENGNLLITDWNYNNDEKQTTHEVSQKAITATGGFYNPNITEEKIAYDDFDIPLYKSFNSDSGLTSSEQKSIKNYDEFKKKALEYGKEVAVPGYEKINNLVLLAESLKGLGPIERKYPDNATDLARILSKAGMAELISLKQQGGTFGALSEKEFERIQDSILTVKTLTSAEKWDEILDDYILTLKSGLPDDYKPSIETPAEPILSTTTTGDGSLFDTIETGLKNSGYDTFTP